MKRIGAHSPPTLKSALPQTTADPILGTCPPKVAWKCLRTGSGRSEGSSAVPSVGVLSGCGGKGAGLTRSPSQPTPTSDARELSATKRVLVNVILIGFSPRLRRRIAITGALSFTSSNAAQVGYEQGQRPYRHEGEEDQEEGVEGNDRPSPPRPQGGGERLLGSRALRNGNRASLLPAITSPFDPLPALHK